MGERSLSWSGLSHFWGRQAYDGPSEVTATGAVVETVLVECDGCGAKPRPREVRADAAMVADRDALFFAPAPSLFGWARLTPRPSAFSYITANMGGSAADLDLCPDCVKRIRVARVNGFPDAPERLA